MTEVNGDQPQSGQQNTNNQVGKGSRKSENMDQYMTPVDLKTPEGKEEVEKKKISDNTKNELKEHWKTVTDGPSGKIVKIKTEMIDNQKNQFETLSDDDENEDELGDIYGVETSEEEIDITLFERVAKESIEEIRMQDLDTLTIAKLSEALFTIHRCNNHKLTRSQIYLKEEDWIKQELKNEINKFNEKEYIMKVDQLAKRIKMTQIEDKENEQIIQELVRELDDISEHKSVETTLQENVKILLNARDTIKLIEEYAKDPMLMVPKEMIRLDECDKEQITTMNYYQLAMAVMYAQGAFGNILTKTRQQLVHKAEQLWRDQQLKNKTDNVNNESPLKKSRGNNLPIVTPGKQNVTNPTIDNPFNMEIPKKTQDMLLQEHEKRKEDRRLQAQNLNGINIANMTPDEEKASFNFCVPNETKSDKALLKIKRSYYIHNRIHVEKSVNAQKIVQMVFRVLRKADPTVLMLPYIHTASQEKFIETEDNIPEDEKDLKTYISVAKRQFAKKFAFSMRISITESPVLVKNRIFDWCKGQKHFIDFKQIGSSNIFAAGWLYKLHQNYYNRDHIREWMTNNCPALEHHVHLAPAKLFKEEGEGESITRTITFGIRVEVTFEKKEEILQQLYQLSWKNGPYKEALFVPFRSNPEYTNDMQIQLMKQHKEYMDQGVQQKVFRMKGVDWEILNIQSGQKTTFKKWMMGLTVNGRKILSSVETGDDFYVRMIYHPDDHKNIQYVYRHLYDTAVKAFGEECVTKMFCLPQSPLRGDIHALEENYSKVLKEAVQSNPQQDDEDKVKPKKIQRRQRAPNVYFGTSNVDASYASITKNETMEAKNNGSNKMEATSTSSTKPKNSKKGNDSQFDVEKLKSEIYATVNKNVDEKLDRTEKRLHKQMNEIKMDNDAKIDSLRDLVKGNDDRTNNKLDMLINHFFPNTEPPNNPPSVSVEQESSPRGGNKK